VASSVGWSGGEAKLRALIQRVDRAAVRVGGEVVGEIGRGLVILLGVRTGDGEEDARLLAKKIAHLRIFPDDEGKLNRSLLDVGGSALSVSQFTLYADLRKGNRPSFTEAAPPDEANRLYDLFNRALGECGMPVQTGVFGEMMLVEIENNGPVTIWLDTATL
jgi:D-tyrosyl-tRNA(Tyr) deacylase